MHHGARGLCFLVLAGLCHACGGGADETGIPALSRPSIDRNYLRDADGRYLSFHGINVAGSSKVPFWVREVEGDDLRFRVPNLECPAGVPGACAQVDAAIPLPHGGELGKQHGVHGESGSGGVLDYH